MLHLLSLALRVKLFWRRKFGVTDFWAFNVFGWLMGCSMLGGIWGYRLDKRIFNWLYQGCDEWSLSQILHTDQKLSYDRQMTDNNPELNNKLWRTKSIFLKIFIKLKKKNFLSEKEEAEAELTLKQRCQAFFGVSFWIFFLFWLVLVFQKMGGDPNPLFW